MGLGERIETVTNDNENKFQSSIQSKEGVINTLQEKNNTLASEKEALQLLLDEAEQENDENKEKLVNFESELNQRVNQFNEVNQANKALINQYKDKIDTMSGIVEEYKQYKIANDKLQNALSKVETENKDLLYTHDKLVADMEILEADRTKSEENTKQEITNLKKEMEFQREKAILQLDKEYQQKINEIREGYNQEIRNMQKNYNDRLQQLFNQENTNKSQ